MSGRDPHALLARAAGKATKGGKQTRHIKEAAVLADLFAKLSTQLAAGQVGPARTASHRAHALLEVLTAMDAQDEHPELASPKCDERQQAAIAWRRLLRPNAETKSELQNHFEARRFSHIRLAPLPPVPAPKARESYKGGIYETVFLPDDPKLAKRLGLPESYAFKHGVTNAGFKLSLHWAIERKLPPSKQRDVYVQSMLETGPAQAWLFNTLRVYRERVRWDDKVQVVRYSIHSTTHAESAEELAAERQGKKARSASKRR